MSLDFGPDLSRTTPGVLDNTLSFLVPTVNDTYRDSATPFTEAYATPVASTDIIGSAIVKNQAGTALLYAGTVAKILQANGTTGWTDRSGKAYSGSATGSWSFAQFGNNTIAANGVDTLQVASGGAFADLATSPAAKIVITHENAVLAFNTSAQPDGWYRSDTGDHTNWTVGAANDVDSGNLRGGVGGPVVAAAVYGPLAIAWKQNAMYGGLFTQGAGGALDPKIRWDFVPGGTGIGCVGQHAFVETDIGIIFISDRDIMLFDGGRPRSIAKKLRQYFFSRAVSKSTIFLTHNEIERNVYIWYAASGIRPNKCIVYNYETGKWGEASSVTNATDGTNDHVTCPVRNANYTDYLAVGGTASNSGLECNAVWVWPGAGTGARLANFAYSKNAGFPANTGPSLGTGYIGRRDVDQTLTRVFVLCENGAAVVANSAQVTAYDSGLTSNQVTAALDSNGHVNCNQNARYFTLNLAWHAGRFELRDLVPQYGDTAGRR